jgi:predicted ferric reductase
MQRAVTGAVWALVYLLAVVAPLFLMLVGDAPPSRGWLVDISVALGFIGLAMLGLQFALTARFNAVDASYGLDVVLRFHREISYVALAMILAHPTLLFIDDPALLALLNIFDAGWQARAGVASVVLLLLIVALSVWRQQVRLPYEAWRLTHGLLALAIVATALWHIGLAGYYVSGPFRRGLWLAMSVVIVGLVVHVRVVKPWRLLRRPWRVRSLEELPGRTWHLWLEADGHGGLAFAPGQFAWLTIDRSPFAIREHPFSLSSSAEHPRQVRFTIKELGDFTSHVGELEPGTRAHLDGPYGAFSYERGQAEAFVFLAGGIGVTPMLSMLRTMRDRGDRRPVWLFYANPTWEEASLREELEDLRDGLDLEVVHVLEEPPDDWDGPVGLIDGELLAARLPVGADRFAYFICGPDPMMDAVEAVLHERGVPSSQLHFERFDFIE